jgi:hypothetical protein
MQAREEERTASSSFWSTALDSESGTLEDADGPDSTSPVSIIFNKSIQKKGSTTAHRSNSRS